MAIPQALLAPSASFVFISRHPLAVSLAHLRFGVRDQSVAELNLHWLVSSRKSVLRAIVSITSHKEVGSEIAIRKQSSQVSLSAGQAEPPLL